jgi:hypothetical protein
MQGWILFTVYCIYLSVARKSIFVNISFFPPTHPTTPISWHKDGVSVPKHFFQIAVKLVKRCRTIRANICDPSDVCTLNEQAEPSRRRGQLGCSSFLTGCGSVSVKYFVVFKSGRYSVPKLKIARK